MNSLLLARTIDHTALRPETTEVQIKQLCREAVEHGFASVCVMPYHVPLAAHLLSELGDGAMPVCAAIGFPNGAHQSVIKAAEVRKALHDGAREIDMVMNVGALKSGHRQVVAADIMAVVMAARQSGAIIVKVIIETYLLTDDEKRLACELAEGAGADFVKTSTGFAGGGATVEDVRLMRAAVGPNIRVKASGGIRDYATAISMIQAGADRIGASAGVAIISPEQGPGTPTGIAG